MAKVYYCVHENTVGLYSGARKKVMSVFSRQAKCDYLRVKCKRIPHLDHLAQHTDQVINLGTVGNLRETRERPPTSSTQCTKCKLWSWKLQDVIVGDTCDTCSRCTSCKCDSALHAIADYPYKQYFYYTKHGKSGFIKAFDQSVARQFLLTRDLQQVTLTRVDCEQFSRMPHTYAHTLENKVSPIRWIDCDRPLGKAFFKVRLVGVTYAFFLNKSSASFVYRQYDEDQYSRITARVGRYVTIVAIPGD